MLQPIEIFCCFARKDQVYMEQLKQHLAQHLRNGTITFWDASLVGPGEDPKKTIEAHLRTARVFLLLISADFFATDYCYQTVMQAALARYRVGEARIIPVLVRSADLSTLSGFQVLPRDEKPIARHSRAQHDTLFVQIVQEIMGIVTELAGMGASSSEADIPTDPSQRRLRAEHIPFTYYPPPPKRHSFSIGYVLLLAGCVILLISAVLEGIFFTTIQQYQFHVQATATAQVLQFNTSATVQVQQMSAKATAASTTTQTGKPPTGFVVTSLADGQPIPNNTILTIHGNYASAGSAQVWVLLNDSSGNYYLQNKPVDFMPNNQWMVENIHPAKGIASILFVYVTPTGYIVFQDMAQMGAFSAFTQLPDGSQILQSITITVTG